MKKKLTVIIIFLVSLTAFAQAGVNKYDAQGKRHGVWKGNYEDTKRMRYEGTFEHGKEKGVFKFYDNDENSTLMATRDFTTGNGTSVTVFYDAEGKKLSEGKEVNRLREGEWKFYHPGKTAIMSTEQYSEGELTGTKKVYFPNGKIAETAEYKKGVRNGAYRKYTEEGVVLEESVYKNGKLHGPTVFRDGTGEVVSKGMYANDLKTGIWQYFENGKLVKEKDKTNLKIELERVRE